MAKRLHGSGGYMRSSVQKETFLLQDEGIDELSEWIGQKLKGAAVDKQGRLRARLFAEEVLLRMQSHLDKNTEVSVTLDMRLKHTCRPRLTFEMVGDPYNPLGGLEGDMGDWDSTLRAAIGLTPLYGYEYGRNVIKFHVPHSGLNSVLLIVFSILIGLLLGIFGAWVIPDSMRQVFANGLLTPTYDMWVRLLNALSGPVVFLTVITTMINTQGIIRRGGNSALVIVRYFVISILDVLVAVLCIVRFRTIGRMPSVINIELLHTFGGSISKIIPSNVFDPFIESNTVQLLFLAFVLGYVLIRMGGQAHALKEVIRESNMLGLRLAGWMSKLVPIFVGAFLCLELWRGQTVLLKGLWRPLLVAVAISLGILSVFIIGLARRTHVSVIEITKKLLPPFITALRTGSLDESYAESLTCCTHALGVDAAYAKEALPQGLVLYMPISAVGTAVFTLFAAYVFNLQVDLLWYVLVIVMVVVVFVATPPVPGANLLAYVVLFSTLGVSEDVLLDAMTFDIVFGIFAGAANQALLHIEMYYQAARFGLLDKDSIRSSSS